MKFQKNICTVEENDGLQSSVSNNVEPIATDADTSPPTIDLEDGISIEEINEESNAEDKNNKEDMTGDETRYFKTVQNNYIIAHQVLEKWKAVVSQSFQRSKDAFTKSVQRTMRVPKTGLFCQSN